MLKIISLCCVFAAALAIALPLIPKEPRCFRVEGGRDYHLEYFIAGIDESNVALKIRRGEQIIYSLIGQKQFRNDIKMPEGQVDICVETTDSQMKQLLIDFFTNQDPLQSLITKGDLKIVQKQLKKLRDELSTTYRNQQYQSERDQIHIQILQESDSKIQWLGIGKIVLLLFSALVQLWIMKGFLKKKQGSVSYEPVRT